MVLISSFYVVLSISNIKALWKRRSISISISRIGKSDKNDLMGLRTGKDECHLQALKIFCSHRQFFIRFQKLLVSHKQQKVISNSKNNKEN